MKTPHPTAPDNIFDTWEVYRKIVSNNNMFHSEIYADVAAQLHTQSQPFSLLDLGCGDAANLAPVLANVPVSHYCGVDLSATALALAKANLGGLAGSVELRCGDLLQELYAQDHGVDVVFSSFALHHLSFAKKAEFFRQTHRRLKTGGFLLLVDTFRAAHEDRDAYLQAYCGWLRGTWRGIDDAEKDLACRHIIENDFPETLADLQTFAGQAGFSASQTISSYQWHQVLRFTA